METVVKTIERHKNETGQIQLSPSWACLVTYIRVAVAHAVQARHDWLAVRVAEPASMQTTRAL